jgi:hypothetical protein
MGKRRAQVSSFSFFFSEKGRAGEGAVLTVVLAPRWGSEVGELDPAGAPRRPGRLARMRRWPRRGRGSRVGFLILPLEHGTHPKNLARHQEISHSGPKSRTAFCSSNRNPAINPSKRPDDPRKQIKNPRESKKKSRTLAYCRNDKIKNRYLRFSKPGESSTESRKRLGNSTLRLSVG